MSEPANGSANPDLPADAVVAPPAGTAVDSPNDAGWQVGQRWRDVVIEAIFTDHSGGVSYLANHVGLMQKVLVRPIRIVESTEWRRRTWDLLRALPESQIVPSIEAYEEGDWRYEVTAAPPATTMRDWVACHRPSPGDIISFVRQISSALAVLHQQGIVHLNIRPDSICVDDSGSEPRYFLAGTHLATIYQQPELIVIPVDPYYAPPEAAGLVRHAPGEGLLAWDWWSLGRMVQEFSAGRHVLGLILDRDVSRPTPELTTRAEQLLLERDPPQVRAGALDYMPDDPASMPVLRGLLTSSAEARWGLNAVQRWLRREAVKDHYDLPRTARMWSWRGRVFTVAEAAEFFTKAEHWDVGEDLLFQTEDPKSLAHFLNTVPAYRADWDRLQAVCELAESVAWQDVPVLVRRTVTAAVSWLSLGAGGGGRQEFRVRGYQIDLGGFAALVDASGVEKGPALFRALISPSVVQIVESLDGPAARVMKTVATNAGRALQLVLAHGWVDRDDSADQARLIALGFLSGSVIRERFDLLRATFATNSNPMLAQIMAGKSPGAADLIALVHLGQSPEKNGFITHDSWRRQRCAALKAEGEQIVTRILWVQAHRLLATSRLWGASSTAFAAVVLGLTAFVGWESRSAALTAVVPVVLLFSRWWLWWRLKGIVKDFDPAASTWKWTDGVGRTSLELKRVLGASEDAQLELRKKLRATRHAIAELITDRTKRPVILEPQFWDVWSCLGAAAVATLVVMVTPLLSHRDNTGDAVVAIKSPKPAVVAPVVVAPEPVLAALNGAIVKDPDSYLATGKYEMVDDGFGRRLRGPLKAWDHPIPQTLAPIDVEKVAEVTAEQAAYALVSGAMLLDPYGKKAVRVLLALRVPTTRGFGIVIYNTRDHELYERRVRLLREPLAHNTWYTLGHYRVLFLESPLPAGTTISLAPP